VELQRGILSDLDELRYRVAMHVLYILGRTQRIDRSTLQWLEPVLREYRGAHADGRFLELLDQFRGLPDAEFREAVSRLEHPGRGIFVKQLQCPLLAASIGELSTLPVEFQRLTLDVVRQLGAINEEIQFSSANFQLTFDSSISGLNRQALEQNIQKGYENIARMCAWLVETINKLEIG
jgi:hypothetical protein